MTREEIRRAFRQGPQEEFSALPEQPEVEISSRLEKKIQRLFRKSHLPISKPKRVAAILLAAVLLVLGGCTMYQTFTNGAYIKLYGPYQNYLTEQTEYHYLVGGYTGKNTSVPHYSMPDPEGYIHLYDGSFEKAKSDTHYDQWYHPDTMETLTLTQQQIRVGTLLNINFPLTSIQQNGITLYYGSHENTAYAIWLNGDTSFILKYRGEHYSQEQFLQWVNSIDYTPDSQSQPPSDFYCYLDDSSDSEQEESGDLKFYYSVWDEVVDQIEDEDTGRQEDLDYNFASPPQGFTLIKTENNTDIGPTGRMPNGSIHFATNGATYTYQNQDGATLILDQFILAPLPDGGFRFFPEISSVKPMEEIQVEGMDGLYVQEEDCARLLWRYGGRLMEITFHGQMSKEELIAMAQTVDYENGIPVIPAPEEETADASA